MIGLLTAVVLTTVRAQSSVNFGFKGGVELIQMNFSAEALKASNRAGFYIGPSLRFKLPIVGFGVDASAFYSQRDLKVAGESATQKCLMLPAHVRYGFDLGDALHIFATAGPQFTFNMGDDIFHWVDENGNDSQFALQNTQLSVDLGVGVGIGTHLEAGLYYNIPTGKTADFTWEELGDKLKDQTWERARTRVNAWHVSLAYYF